ncbi:MAG: trypsin-like peptidase domain-containing protein [Acidobacteria bacterium]|nr:trypsin-like peptidase domain-containing protein [Acidobacteriota bacterium]
MRLKNILLLAILTNTLPAPAPGQAADTEQRRASICKPSVVRIIDGVSANFTFTWEAKGIQKQYPVSTIASGSGFFVNPSGFIATNAHVVEITKEFTMGNREKALEPLINQYVQSVCRDLSINPASINDAIRREILSMTTVNGEPQNIHLVLMPDKRHLPFAVRSFGAPVGEGKDIAVIKIDVQNAPVLKLGDFEKVQLQDHITVIGFPAAADTDVLDSASILEPSITDGKVSARKTLEDGCPVLQISAPTTHGNSGGPVLNDRGEVIGMLTFRGDTVGGQEVSGFSFIFPSTAIMDFIHQAGTTNTDSPSTAAFTEALNFYWNENFSAAKTKFEEVLRLYPQHLDAGRFVEECRRAIGAGRDKPIAGAPSGGASTAETASSTDAKNIWLWVGIGGGGLVLVLTVVILIVVGRKKKVPPEAPYGGYEAYEQPPEAYPPYGEAPYGSAPPAYPDPGYGASPPPPYPPAGPYGEAPYPQGYGPVEPQPPVPPPPPPGMGYPGQAAPDSFGKTIVVPPAFASPGEIVFTSGPLRDQRFALSLAGVYIGRDANSAQVVIPDGRVSKRHLWVGIRDGQPILQDMGSTNGTFVNALGTPRVSETVLQNGDTVIISEADVARFIYRK